MKAKLAILILVGFAGCKAFDGSVLKRAANAAIDKAVRSDMTNQTTVITININTGNQEQR